MDTHGSRSEAALGSPSSGKRERLLEAAHRLFALHGFHAIGIDRILAKAGVAKMTLYHHFRSKKDLILAVLDRQHRRKRERWQCTPRGEPLAAFDVVGDCLADGCRHGCLFMKAVGEFPEAENAIRRKALAHREALLAHLVDQASLAGATDPELLARQLLLLLEGAVGEAHYGAARPVDRARETAALLLEVRPGTL